MTCKEALDVLLNQNKPVNDKSVSFHLAKRNVHKDVTQHTWSINSIHLCGTCTVGSYKYNEWQKS